MEESKPRELDITINIKALKHWQDGERTGKSSYQFLVPKHCWWIPITSMICIGKVHIIRFSQHHPGPQSKWALSFKSISFLCIRSHHDLNSWSKKDPFSVFRLLSFKQWLQKPAKSHISIWKSSKVATELNKSTCQTTWSWSDKSFWSIYL